MYGYDRPGIPVGVWIVLVALYGGWCLVNYLIAFEKNRNAGGLALASILGSPFLVWLYLVAVPSVPLKPEAEYETIPGSGERFKREKL